MRRADLLASPESNINIRRWCLRLFSAFFRHRRLIGEDLNSRLSGVTSSRDDRFPGHMHTSVFALVWLVEISSPGTCKQRWGMFVGGSSRHGGWWWYVHLEPRPKSGVLRRCLLISHWVASTGPVECFKSCEGSQDKASLVSEDVYLIRPGHGDGASEGAAWAA